MSTVFAFDFGTGSLAAVIRSEDKIIFKKSYKMHPKFASTGKSAEKRRANRTRKAHRAREFWWNQQAAAIGLPILKNIIKTEAGDYRAASVDDKLKREFPAEGDETIYCSTLLRITILEGRIRELSDWQIYKAIHSAMQKRGYDAEIPWRVAETKKIKKSTDDQEEDESAKVGEFRKFLDELNIPEEFHFCCYFDAYRMGLWTPEKGITSIRISHRAEATSDRSGKGYTPPRSMVTNELRRLLLEIKKVKPSLDVDLVLYGPGREAYASFNPKNSSGLKRGKETDWQGLLGQKIPRFDNRIIEKCMLMPRFNVCKAQDELYRKFHFASALHKLRVRDENALVISRPLAFSEYHVLYTRFEDKLKATAKQLETALDSCGHLAFAGESYAIEAAKFGGRTSFCRPTLRILLEMLTNGLSPSEMRTKLLRSPRAPGHDILIADNQDPAKGLITSDLDWLKQIEDRSWEDFYLPQTKLDQRYSDPDSDEAIRKVIGSVNNPVVRHRLSLLVDTLKSMQSVLLKEIGKSEPDDIAFEIIREDFLGQAAKTKLKKFQNERKKANQDAIDKAQELHIPGRLGPKKYQLLARQGGMCLYSGLQIPETQLDDCQIDHIVPQERGGSDAFYNLILTFRDENLDKGVRTPYEWLSSDDTRWNAFRTRVINSKTMSRKTKELLTSPDAYALVEKYTNLAETAYISRLANTVIHLFFGWKPTHLEGKKKIQFITGGLTARVRRKYDLNSILSENDQKNRDNPNHHILDALVLSFIPEWARQKDKSQFFSLPKGIDRSFFVDQMAGHFPIEFRDKPELEENYYSQHSDSWMTKRTEIKDLAYKSEAMKRKFDLKSLSKRIEKIRSLYEGTELLASLEKIAAELANNTQAETLWNELCDSLHLGPGSKAKKIKIPDGISNEVKPVKAGALGGIQLIKPKGNHRGFFIALDGKIWKAMPVYAHESIFQGIRRLKGESLEIRNHKILCSGDMIIIKKSFDKFESGQYRLNTITNGTNAVLAPLDDIEHTKNISINRLVREGDFIQLDLET